MLKGRRRCTGDIQVLVLLFLVTCSNRSAYGSSSTGGLPPPVFPWFASFPPLPPLPSLSLPSLPFLPRIPGINDPPKRRNPSYCTLQDALALLAFRAQLSDPRDALSSWLPVTDCCGWRGVTCSSAVSSEGRRVIGLQLTLQGQESENSFLSLVSATHNMAGIPLSGLSSLETLSLTSVLFNSDLPLAWGALSNLTSLSLVNCALTGGLPEAYAGLHNLRHLQLSNNRLSGQLPLFLTDVFRQLVTLDLSSNSFTGVILLLFRSNLTSLDLGHNGFDDNPLPDLFSFLPKLRHLDLSHNRLGGSIPQSMQHLGELRFLDLSVNRLDGSVPPALFAIQTLTSVFLHDNSLSGLIPVLFAQSSHIQELDLSNNSLSGIIPPTIGMLGRLQLLDLSHNNLALGIPDTLVFNSKLEFLFLENNSITGWIPPELGGLHNLVLANVSHNLLFGPIPGGPWPTFPSSSFDANPGICGQPLKNAHVQITGPNATLSEDENHYA